jgi:hypothetical protein
MTAVLNWRYIAKWVGLGLCLFIAAAWAWSITTNTGCVWIGARHDYLFLFGSVSISTRSPANPDPRGFHWAHNAGVREYGLTLPRFGGPRGTQIALLLPLWTLLVLAIIPTGVLFWLARPRPQSGHCRRCGYDLTLNVSGRCPECGTVIEPGDARETAG